MSINVTIVICTFIIGVVVLGSKLIEAKVKNKGIADVDALTKTVNDISLYVKSQDLHRKAMCEKIELMHGTEMRSEKHLARMLEKQDVTNKHIREIELNISNLMDIREHLDAIKQNVIRNVGVKSLIDAVRHTNSLIEDNCTILKSEVGNIYSETASIDSRLNGYFGEKHNAKE